MKNIINYFIKAFEKNSSNTLLAILFLTYFCIAVFLVIPAGTFYYDEGWAANIGYHIANGEVLYKDISAPYGPVVFYVYAFLIGMFGKQFIIFRVFGISIIILQSYFSARIISFFTENKAIIIFTALIALLPLGFYQSGRITASTIAGLLTLMIAFNHLSYFRKRKRIYLINAGALLALLLLTKHNVFGIDLVVNFIFMALVIFFMYKKERKIDYGYFLLPLGSFLAILVTYIALIFPFITDFLKDTILSISQYQSSDMVIPFPTPSDLINMGLKQSILSALFLYSIFLLIPAACLVLFKLSQRSKNFDLGIVFITLLAIFHFIEIYPLSDYSHYSRATVVYAPFISMMLLLAYHQKNTISQILIVFGLSLHLYKAPLYLYSNIKTIISEPASSLKYNKHIRRIPKEDQILKVLDEIKDADNAKVMIIGHASIYYYLSDNISSSRFNTITHHYLDKVDQIKVIEEIKQNEIGYLIEAPSVRTQKELDELKVLGSYIKDNFLIKKKVEGFTFWYRES
tara:strand:- start:7661 stop:9208 length:1548 start_codon:yes stop_codon:yes gene_type:complete